MSEAASTWSPPFRLEELPIAMAALDSDLCVVASNPRFEELVGGGADVQGRDVFEMLTKAATGVDRMAGGQIYNLGDDIIDCWIRLDLQRFQGGILAALVDVTSERNALDDFRFAHQTRDGLLLDAEVGVWRYDPELALFRIETTTETDDDTGAFGRDALAQTLHPDDVVGNFEVLDRIASVGGSAQAEVRRKEPGGGWSHLQVHYRSGRRTACGLYEVYGLNQNVTPVAMARDEANAAAQRLQVALDAAEAATDAKSNFLASVSHEIRTPMNGIVAVLNLLKREALSPDGLHLLKEAIACSGMLGQLIDDVLDFSKIEAGRLDLTPEPCDPVQIAQSVCSILGSQALAKGLSLRVEAVSAMGGASLDPMRLRQCLFNIIGNAVKFTEAGGVGVRLSYLGEGAGRRLRCEVQDTGVGVPEAARGRLFERFQQAEAGANRKFGGTGLGLAISRSLARMMGGDMDFTSVEGHGSTFWFEVAAPPAETEVTTESSVFAGAPLEGLDILVVDDNATNRLVAVKSLEALGAQASAVDSGEAAIEAAANGAFDLILMDINMPRMDGLEATRHIRALGSAAANVPVIALTADVMSHHQEAYRAAGLSGVVSKPFSPAQLLAEINRLASDESGDAVSLSA